MPEVQRPWVLAAIPLFFVSWALLRVGASRGLVVAGGVLELEAARLRSTLAGFQSLLRGTGLVVLAFAAAGPFAFEPAPAPAGEGIAIVVALDVSESMREGRLGDTDRLGAALDELQRFIAGRDTDLIGLVTFAGRAASRVPPVADRAPLEAAIERVRGDAPGDGTALGSAIGVAANRLRAVEARSKIVVAITDGENNAGPLDPVTAATAAAALGVRTYTIGVGEEAANVLGAVAAAGEGSHFGVLDRAGLDDAYREIDALERGPTVESSSQARVPLHTGFLWAATLLLAVEALLRSSRRSAVS